MGGVTRAVDVMNGRVKQIYMAMMDTKRLVPSPEAGKMFLRWLIKEERDNRKKRKKPIDMDAIIRYWQERQ